jgi:hypothetical protein
MAHASGLVPGVGGENVAPARPAMLIRVVSRANMAELIGLIVVCQDDKSPLHEQRDAVAGDRDG